MTRFTPGISLGVILALASFAEAKTVSIDYTGASPVSMGLTQVNTAQTKDGTTVIAQRGGKNVAMTGNSSASQYLYLAIDPAFKQGLQHVWLTVEYFDEGTGAFQVQYDGQDDAHQTASNPATRSEFNTKDFTHQTWHLTNFKLAGGEEGGADLRIDDMMNGPVLVSKVTVSDTDPDFAHFPYAVTPITIDGKIDAGEWDGAYTVTLDRAQYDVTGNWKSKDDFSGTYSFKYDENALYLLGQVVDATPRLNDQGGNTGGQWWDGDGMELCLGLDDSNPEITDGMAMGTDFKLMIGLGDTPSWAIADRGVFSDGNPPIDLGPIGDKIAIVNTDNPKGYVFELRIPWNIYNNLKAKQGQLVRWAMFANNSREINPSGQDDAMSPTGRGNINKDISGWTRAMLDPKP
jgi:cellulose/xylan binding protein with CBM9 domain